MKTPKKKAKTPKTTTRMRKRKIIVVDEILDLCTFLPRPITEQYVLRIGEEIVKWARSDPDAHELLAFYNANGFLQKDAERWGKKFPLFKRAIAAAKNIISVRRQRALRKREVPEKSTMFILPVYSEEWDICEDFKKVEQWRSGLKTEEAKAANENRPFVLLKSIEDLKKERKKGD